MSIRRKFSLFRDRSWERFGTDDPYWAVLTAPRFRREAMTDADRAEFFESGRVFVGQVLANVTRFFGDDVKRDRALDFGCGVGRIALPLSERCGHVVGVDVARSMLAEARKNATSQARTNVTFVESDDTLSRVEGPFDLVHSVIVFQHIPVALGLQLYARLLDLLAPGGVAACHFVYRQRGSSLKNKLDRVRLTRTPFRQLSNVVEGRAPFAPLMQMNEYDLGDLFAIAADRGVRALHVEQTDHGGYLGAMIYLRRPS
ncbi:MAG: class I SAM-dependent methyltransferase [Polyangiales bacterium]